MIPVFNVLTEEQVQEIHDRTIHILETIGVEFKYEPALEVFCNHGQRIEGERVFFTREFIESMIESAPSQFTLLARNPENNLVCGGENTIFMPGYGAAFIQEANGSRRSSNMNDYDNFVKLAGASKNQHMTGGNVIEPSDVNEHIRHLRMMYSHITNSDKCFMGSALGYLKANESIEMASIVFGKEAMSKDPAVICLINSITPLIFDERMAGAIMAYAEQRQAMIVAALVMSGSTGPVSLAGAITVQNAEVLAGISLAQAINPGTPVVYGSSSALADMTSGALSIGCPECSLFTTASAQLARFYDLPSRGGGGLTDAKVADAQAGLESMMNLWGAGVSRINFVLHAAGILESYNAMSYEKFIIDDEICGMLLRYLQGIDFSEEMFAYDVIKEVGPGGHFLYEDHTVENFRKEQRFPDVSNRDVYGMWAVSKPDIVQVAHDRWQSILDSYEPPALDEAINEKLLQFIEDHSK